MASPLPLNVKLGRIVQQLRRAAGPSQEAFAYIAGVHRTHMSALERGVGNPTLKTLELVAKGLHLTLWELFRAAETGEMPAVAPIKTTLHEARNHRRAKLSRVAERRDGDRRFRDRN